MKEKDVVEAILDMGLKRGTITCDEINDLFTPEIFPLEEMERLMDLFYDLGIRIVGLGEYAT